MQLPSSVQETEPAPGFPVFEITHATCSARVALQGAHVMEWQPTSAPKPILYLSPKSILRPGSAIRGGIPICWPWFGAHPEGEDRPFHGLARTQPWELIDASEDSSGVCLILTLTEGPLKATATLNLGDRLSVSLETENLGKERVPVSGALHSYFKIDEITLITIGGLAGCDYLDTVGTPTQRSQNGPVIFAGEVDRIYDSSRMVRIDDPGLDRLIMVEKSGSPSTVVWNPWLDKSATLVDLPNDGYLGFACVEAAISNDKAIQLDPGKSHTLSTTLYVGS